MNLIKKAKQYNSIIIFTLLNIFIQIVLFACKKVYPEDFIFISPAAAYGQLLANAILISTQIGKSLEVQDQKMQLFKIVLNNSLLIVATLISPFFSGTYFRNQIIRDGGFGIRNNKFKSRYIFLLTLIMILFFGFIFYFLKINNWSAIYLYFGFISFISIKLISFSSSKKPILYIPSLKSFRSILKLSLFDFVLALSPAIILGLLFSNVTDEIYQIALQFVLATLATGFFSNVFQTLFISKYNLEKNNTISRERKNNLSNYDLLIICFFSIISASSIAIFLELPFIAILLTAFYGLFGVISSRSIVNFRENCNFIDKFIASLVWFLFLLLISLLLINQLITGIWTLSFFIIGALINIFIKEIVILIKNTLFKNFWIN